MYLRPSDILLQPHVLQGTLPLTNPFQVRMTASGTSLTMQTNSDTRHNPLSPVISYAFEHPILVLADAHPTATLVRLNITAVSSVSVPVQGWLRTTLHDLFGENLSPVHDVLPLLETKATIQLGRDEPTGPVKLLLEGTIDDRTETEQMLLRLEQHFLETLPLSEVRSRVFEDDMVFDDIRRSGSGSLQTTRTVGRWEVREIKHEATGRFLIVGLSDRSFILSTSASAVDAFINETHGRLALPVVGPGRILGGGQADGSALQNFLQFFLPEGTTMPNLEGVQKWSVVENGGRTTVMFAK